ncbi:MAG: type II toxin-antitoxin system Phd/YefM family antitoxin [Chitinispirillaceae bacterium]|nr:type II toxin-antitoxin system Phd/YefM family antitoxin [Chitinispirillaceae bacterium]
MTSITVTEAKKKLNNLVGQTKDGGALLVSEDDWSAIQETLHLLAIPGMRESITEGY